MLDMTATTLWQGYGLTGWWGDIRVLETCYHSGDPQVVCGDGCSLLTQLIEKLGIVMLIPGTQYLNHRNKYRAPEID